MNDIKLSKEELYRRQRMIESLGFSITKEDSLIGFVDFLGSHILLDFSAIDPIHYCSYALRNVWKNGMEYGKGYVKALLDETISKI